VWELFDRMLQNTRALAAMADQTGVGAKLRRAGLMLGNGLTFAKLYLTKARHAELPANVRLEPVW
jgi:hypothetical protein